MQPIRHCRARDMVRLPTLYYNYLKDWKRYSALGGNAPFHELAPNLFDCNEETQSGGGQYFYQDIWALNKVAEYEPSEHHDVGSRFDGFVGQATALCHVICYDIRPPGFKLPRFEFRKGSILHLPVEDQSISSLSCLHVVEHIGLGRYGDPLDPDGTLKALRELMRVLAPGGQLLLGIPVGRERVCFNNQRVLHPKAPVNILGQLKLTEFKAVNEAGEFLEDASFADLENAEYSCGLYRFNRD